MFTHIAKGAIFIYGKNSSFCLEALSLAIFSKIYLIYNGVKYKLSFFYNGITKIVFGALHTFLNSIVPPINRGKVRQ